MIVVFATCFMFIGCCSNSIFLEVIVRKDPGSGPLITFSQFLFIATEGFIFVGKCGTKKSIISKRDYVLLVVMFFISNLCNNYALNFNIPMPLHTIFRSSSLIANMSLGIFILKRNYTIRKYISVFMITIGVIVCTYETAKDVQESQLDLTSFENEEVENESSTSIYWWSIGIILLTIALFMSARMGIYQEELCHKYGKHPREALYYTHFLPLPGFLFLMPNISHHLVLALESETINLGLDIFFMPYTIFFLAANVISQYICIRSVYVLTTECTSLTVTLMLTLRKFVSLVFSVIYFQNKFTSVHWFGAFLLFSGTLLFTEFNTQSVKIKKNLSENVALLSNKT